MSPRSIAMPTSVPAKLLPADQLVARLLASWSSAYHSETIAPLRTTTTPWVLRVGSKAYWRASSSVAASMPSAAGSTTSQSGSGQRRPEVSCDDESPQPAPVIAAPARRKKASAPAARIRDRRLTICDVTVIGRYGTKNQGGGEERGCRAPIWL